MTGSVFTGRFFQNSDCGTIILTEPPGFTMHTSPWMNKAVVPSSCKRTPESVLTSTLFCLPLSPVVGTSPLPLAQPQPRAHSPEAGSSLETWSSCVGEGGGRAGSSSWWERMGASTRWPHCRVSSQQLLPAHFSGVLHSPILGVLSSTSCFCNCLAAQAVHRQNIFLRLSLHFSTLFFSFCPSVVTPTYHVVPASLCSSRYLLQTPSRLSLSQVNTCLAVLIHHQESTSSPFANFLTITTLLH